MEFIVIRENWPQIKLKLKAKYPQLTDGDLNYIEGYDHEFFKNLQIKTGRHPEELQGELKNMAKA